MVAFIWELRLTVLYDSADVEEDSMAIFAQLLVIFEEEVPVAERGAESERFGVTIDLDSGT